MIFIRRKETRKEMSTIGSLNGNFTVERDVDRFDDSLANFCHNISMDNLNRASCNLSERVAHFISYRVAEDYLRVYSYR